MYTQTTNYHWEVNSEISTVTLWQFRQIHLHDTICNGINLVEKKDQTRLEDMVSAIGCTVNVVEGKRKQQLKRTRNKQLHFIWIKIRSYLLLKQMHVRRRLYFSKKVCYQTIDLKHICRDKILEICSVKIKLKSTEIILGCIYRAPSGSINEFLDIEIPWIGFRRSNELEDICRINNNQT